MTAAPIPGVTPAGRRWAWVSAAVVSGAVLAVFLTQVDVAAVEALVAGANAPLLAMAFLGFLGESAAAALRLRELTPRPHPRRWRGFIAVTALHGIYLAVLPARLGDAAYAVLMHRRLALPPGGAVASLLYQRLCDLGVLALVLVTSGAVLVAGAAPSAAARLGVPLAALVGAGIAVAWLRFDRLLEIAAYWTHRRLGRRRRAAAWLCRTALQGRRWSAMLGGRARRLRVLAWTVLGWSAMLGGIAVLLRGLGLEIGIAEAVLVGVGYNLIGALPIHSIGGIGVGEVGLAGILVALGHPLETAVPVALLARLVLISAPFVVAGALLPLLVPRQLAGSA